MTKPILKPFLKWAGGKGQLLSQIRPRYPKEIKNEINRYCEPFIGGGAVLFDLLSHNDFEEIYISDTNKELVNTYVMIRDNIEGLIENLITLKSEYLQLDTEARKVYYYSKRDKFNNLKINGDGSVNLQKAGLFIFLNRTCFNGLFRVNSKGLFNVPIGSYKNPLICDEENLKNISTAIRNVNIECADYRSSLSFIDKNTFVYIDPPYRPLTKTASFTAYNETPFDDNEQIALSKYVSELDKLGAKVVVSNSDPKNTDIEDNFFDELYSAFQMSRVLAKRMINCNGDSRGNVSELLIYNF